MSYQPQPPRRFTSLQEATDYFYTELRRIADRLNNPIGIQNFEPLGAQPQKPREGDVVFADGVNWDPQPGLGPNNGGKGLYVYTGSAYEKLNVLDTDT